MLLRLPALSLSRSIFAGLVVVCVATVVIVVTATVSLMAYRTSVQEMEIAARHWALGERVNAEVISVVSDSRGIYMRDNWQGAKPFADALLSTLTTLDSDLARWQAMVPAVERAAFVPVVDSGRDFIATRRELVRLAQEVGMDQARAHGDNDANRATRQAFNKTLQAAAARNDAIIDRLMTKVRDEGDRLLTIILAVAAVGLFGGVGLSLVVVRRGVIAPLAEIGQAMERVAGGNLQTPVPGLQRLDEIGRFAAALETFKAAAHERVALESEIEQTMLNRQQHMQALADAFSTNVLALVDHVAESATEMLTNARVVRDQAGLAALRLAEVSGASGQATANVHTVATATEEMAATVTEVGRQIGNAARAASDASAQAQAGNTTVGGLAEAATRIGEVVALIEDIAARTNLLALNATIEAARAGEAGKGFAVVATEVKALANQTARATDDIREQITAIQQRTQHAVDAIGTIARRVADISGINAAVAGAVDQQSAATSDIASNVTQAARMTGTVNDSIAEVARGAKFAEQSTADMAIRLEELASGSVSMRGEVDRFLTQLRVA
jgi:methyl-accepting chemotaxis protein